MTAYSLSGREAAPSLSVSSIRPSTVEGDTPSFNPHRGLTLIYYIAVIPWMDQGLSDVGQGPEGPRDRQEDPCVSVN